MLHNHWLRITHSDLQPQARAKHNMIHNHWLSLKNHDSQPLAQHNQL